MTRRQLLTGTAASLVVLALSGGLTWETAQRQAIDAATLFNGRPDIAFASNTFCEVWKEVLAEA